MPAAVVTAWPAAPGLVRVATTPLPSDWATMLPHASLYLLREAAVSEVMLAELRMSKFGHAVVPTVAPPVRFGLNQ